MNNSSSRNDFRFQRKMFRRRHVTARPRRNFCSRICLFKVPSIHRQIGQFVIIIIHELQLLGRLLGERNHLWSRVSCFFYSVDVNLRFNFVWNSAPKWKNLERNKFWVESGGNFCNDTYTKTKSRYNDNKPPSSFPPQDERTSRAKLFSRRDIWHSQH